MNLRTLKKTLKALLNEPDDAAFLQRMLQQLDVAAEQMKIEDERKKNGSPK